MLSDAELMLAFAGGDSGAFDELVSRHQSGLVNFFFRMVWDRDIAEDLAQEVFIRVYSHRENYEPRAKFTTYLYRIAKNCAVDHLRKAKKHNRVLSLDAETESGHSLYDELLQKGDSPSERARKEEFTEAIIEAIESLPEDHRMCFILSEVQGMKYAEISEALDVPVGTVKSRMHNATKKLREKLKDVQPRGTQENKE